MVGAVVVRSATHTVYSGGGAGVIFARRQGGTVGERDGRVGERDGWVGERDARVAAAEEPCRGTGGTRSESR